jgi:hypothetical protein
VSDSRMGKEGGAAGTTPNVAESSEATTICYDACLELGWEAGSKDVQQWRSTGSCVWFSCCCFLLCIGSDTLRFELDLWKHN